MGKLQLKGALPSRIRFNNLAVPRAYLGTELVWEFSALEGPKVDTSHPLATGASMRRLTLGALEGMTADANYIVANQAFASKTAGTMTFVKEPLPATSPTTLRVSALIKVDKTSGRYSRVGFASNTTNPDQFAVDIYIGHNAGSGIVVNSHAGGISLSQNVLSEAQLVDGAWYRVTVVWDSVLDQSTATTNAGKNRVYGTAEPVDPAHTPANPWHVTSWTSKHAPTNIPRALVARTNSALGTIRDLAYADSMFGVNGDNAPIQYNAKQGDGSNASDLMWIWSKAKAAPLRVIITAGGSGLYGGDAWATGSGRSNEPYNQWRKTWRDLADLGYTVLHTQALHEGWGADDHLTKQLESLNYLKTHFGADVRLYYLAYSMGSLSAWRAIMGRAGYPAIRAAYIIGGVVGLDEYYDVPMYAQIKTRWPNRAALDEPRAFSTADLISRGTRVRLITSLADTNVPKTANHDVMKAKYGTSSLFSELVHTTYNHFDPGYWDAIDMASFFEDQDADSAELLFSDSFNRASFGSSAAGWAIFGGGFTIIDNQGSGTASGGTYNYARTVAALPNNNGYGEVKVTNYTGSSFGVMVRMPNDGNITGYLWRYDGVNCQLFRVVNGSFTAVGSPYVATLTAPFTLRLSAVDKTIFGSVDGVIRAQYTESELSVGAHAGLRVQGTTARFDDFKFDAL